MYEVKNRIYKNFNRVQKTGLCNFLRALVKQNLEQNVDLIYDNFVEDERYYLELNVSKFEFVADFLDDREFERDTKLYLKECKKYYEYKKSQAPIIAAQKEYEKKKRTRGIVLTFLGSCVIIQTRFSGVEALRRHTDRHSQSFSQAAADSVSLVRVMLTRRGYARVHFVVLAHGAEAGRMASPTERGPAWKTY